MIQKAKGTYDVFGTYGKRLLYVEELIEGLMEKYNYEYVRTPIFESSELFHRGVGVTTDIVTKETYDFTDRGNRNMTLRPEGTAGVVRSYVENKMYANPGLAKVYYCGPMFRHERPQAGRFRQFTQFGVEVFGDESPLLDADTINMCYLMLKEIGIQARQDIEEFLGKQVFLETHVKTIEDWRDKEKYLIEFGLKEIN